MTSRINPRGRGVVDTPLAHSLGNAKEVYDALVHKAALRRIAQPEEVSKVIGFLLSEEAGYITASVRGPFSFFFSFFFFFVCVCVIGTNYEQVINVDGGYT